MAAPRASLRGGIGPGASPPASPRGALTVASGTPGGTSEWSRIRGEAQTAAADDDEQTMRYLLSEYPSLFTQTVRQQSAQP